MTLERVYRVRRWKFATLYTGGKNTKFILRVGRITVLVSKKK